MKVEDRHFVMTMTMMMMEIVEENRERNFVGILKAKMKHENGCEKKEEER